jgi:acetate kinase
MKILVLNAGSSSLKYTVFESSDLHVAAKGVIERIGDKGGRIGHQYQQSEGLEKVTFSEDIENHHDALLRIVSLLTDEEHGILTDISEIYAVGHRVVHGGEYFSSPRLVDEDLKEKVAKLEPLAPLHNPPNLLGIQGMHCQKNTTPIMAFVSMACMELPTGMFQKRQQNILGSKRRKLT